MTREVYPLAAEAALESLFPDDPTIQALGSGYTYDAAHAFADDLTDLIGDAIVLTSVDYTAGILTADDPTITGMTLGDQITGFAVYNDTGTPATSQLVGFLGEAPGGGAIVYTATATSVVVSFPGLTIVRL